MVNAVRHNNNDKVRKTCLLVDDDEDDTEIFAIAMGEADSSIDCVFASDAAAALSLLEDKSFVPDYIFLDLNMPQMSGKECLVETFRRMEYPNKERIAIVLLTSSVSEKDKAYAMSLGVRQCLSKPLTEESLSAVVQSIYNSGAAPCDTCMAANN